MFTLNAGKYSLNSCTNRDIYMCDTFSCLFDKKESRMSHEQRARTATVPMPQPLDVPLCAALGDDQ